MSTKTTYVAKFESGEIVESSDFAAITKAVIETASPLVSVTREEIVEPEPVRPNVIEAGVVVNDEGREFTVVVHLPGSSYVGSFDRKDGRGFTEQMNESPTVGFYDRTYKGERGVKEWEAYGQFTGASYYLSTLRDGLDRMDGRPLSLVGDIPVWTISADNVREAVAMADAVLARI